MIPQAVLIQTSVIDLDLFLRVTQQTLGVNLASKADNSLQRLSPSDKLMSCLAEMQECPSDLRKHCFYSVLVLGLEDDLFDILEICSMPFVTAETTRRGVFSAVISGTLDQWDKAVENGKRSESEAVREGFDQISTFFGKQYKRITA